MADAGSVLTQKIGPLPAWAWGGIAAVAAWFFFLRGKSTPATTRTASQGASTTGDYSLGFAQGLQSAAAGQPGGSSSAPATTPLAKLVAGSNQTGLFGDPSSDHQVTYVAGGTPLTPTGPPVAGKTPYGATSGFWAQSNYWQPVNWEGQTLYVWAPFAQQAPGTGGPVGGPAPRKHAIGSRSAHEWHDAHPLVGGQVRYPHYVRAVGGPGNHINEVHRVARAAGVHPARVLMLNPVHTGRIRVA